MAVISGIVSEPHPEIVVGATLTGFLNEIVPAEARETIRENSISILSSARVDPASQVRRTGLVVGRVQSGKTLSYEALIALARDNGFPLVVVISGISNPLLDQGVRRLRGDLTKADPNGWTFLVNPAGDAQEEASLASIKENWDDPETPLVLKKTAVCLLLKHHGRIGNFAELCARIGWAGQRVLVIDDEADQASLNAAFRRGQESATYANIRRLRDAFPHHAYIQYTATPQAPLLLAISDQLSPDFVKVIEPGEGYVGGADYFGAPNQIVKVIPDADLQLAADPDGPPPASLIEALREFVIGPASLLSQGRASTRSMLVHPSRLTGPHAAFVRWVRAVVDLWRGAFEDETDAESLKEQFRGAWESINSTDSDLPGFEACWGNVRFVLRNLQLIEMNARDQQTPVIDWDPTMSYVLVGGQALDRGFTINGLSVTYMNRDGGSWTADTIQQRARFFGYKREFFGQCRLYLEPNVRGAFEAYVEHESHMLNSLRSIEGGRSTLKEWERELLLAPGMRATRSTVTSLPTISVSQGERWVFDSRSPDESERCDDAVRDIGEILSRFQPESDEYDNDVYDVSVSDALEIVEAHTTSGVQPTVPQLRALKLRLAKLSDDSPAERVRVLRMRPRVDGVRTLTSAGNVQPFQGRSANYPGDRDLHAADDVTLQLHVFDIRETRDSAPFAKTLRVAAWTPQRLASSWLLEDTDS